VQLCFWTVAIGAVASSLIKAGGATALEAVQAASIITSLPLNILGLYIMQCLYVFCREADKPDRERLQICKDDEVEFKTPIYGGMFNLVEYVVSLGRVHVQRVNKGMHMPSHFHLVEYVKGVLAPFWSLNKSLQSAYPDRKYCNYMLVISYSLCQTFWISLLCTGSNELTGLFRTFFVLSGLVLAFIRYNFRQKYNLRSNIFGDLVASTLFWPQVLMQFSEVLSSDKVPERKNTVEDDVGIDQHPAIMEV
jgi:BCCT, betaine/carnitine/choline family transporter